MSETITIPVTSQYTADVSELVIDNPVTKQTEHVDLLRLAVVSDGEPGIVKIVDAETGRELDGVVDFTLTRANPLQQYLTVKVKISRSRNHASCSHGGGRNTVDNSLQNLNGNRLDGGFDGSSGLDPNGVVTNSISEVVTGE